MDIVERLRIRIHTSEDETALTNEAADEIERLRKEIELLHIRIDYYMKVLALRDDIQQKDTE